jgi:hypothetical protein
MTGSDDLARALATEPDWAQRPAEQPFLSAVKACVSLGADGEALLLAAFPTASYERRTVLLLALSFFPSHAVAGFLRQLAADESSDASLRCSAVWALGRIRRPEDAPAVVALLNDRSRVVRDQALLVCPYLGVQVPPELALQLLARLAKRQRPAGSLGDPTQTVAAISLLALGTPSASVLGDSHGVLRRLWPRMVQREREWLARYWPAAAAVAARRSERLQPASAEEREMLVEWWDGCTFFSPPASLVPH